jgi:hypothetical protein
LLIFAARPSQNDFLAARTDSFPSTISTDPLNADPLSAVGGEVGVERAGEVEDWLQIAQGGQS